MTQQNAAPGVETPAGGAPPPGEGGQPGGTPNPAPAEAGGKGGSNVDWQEKARFWESEAKKAFTERDQLKGLRERAAKADELERASKEREEREAVQRGEYQKLFEARTAELTALQQKLKEADDAKADIVRRHRSELARRDLRSAYRGLGGVDEELFDTLASRALESGEVAVDDNGQVNGVEAFLKKIRDGKPHLFGGGGQAAGASSPGSLGAAGPILDPKKLNPDGRRGSLARGPVFNPEQHKSFREMMQRPKKP